MNGGGRSRFGACQPTDEELRPKTFSLWTTASHPIVTGHLALFFMVTSPFMGNKKGAWGGPVRTLEVPIGPPNPWPGGHSRHLIGVCGWHARNGTTGRVPMWVSRL